MIPLWKKQTKPTTKNNHQKNNKKSPEARDSQNQAVQSKLFSSREELHKASTFLQHSYNWDEILRPKCKFPNCDSICQHEISTGWQQQT